MLSMVCSTHLLHKEWKDQVQVLAGDLEDRHVHTQPLTGHRELIELTIFPF